MRLSQITKADPLAESFIGDIIRGGIMKFKASTVEIPQDILQQPKLVKLIERAETIEGDLFDQANHNWWLQLVEAFSNSFTNRRVKKVMKTADQLANEIKRTTKYELGGWAQSQEQTQAQEPSNTLDQAHQELAPEEAKPAAKPRTKQVDVRKELQKLIEILSKKYKKPTVKESGYFRSCLTEGLGDILRGIGNSTGIAQAAKFAKSKTAKNWLHKAIDMLHPNHRSVLGSRFARKQTNRMIALHAIKAAINLATDLQKRYH